jgi:hypothetical protein
MSQAKPNSAKCTKLKGSLKHQKEKNKNQRDKKNRNTKQKILLLWFVTVINLLFHQIPTYNASLTQHLLI